MDEKFKNRLVRGLRIFCCGALSATVVFIWASPHIGRVIKKQTNDPKDMFPKPDSSLCLDATIDMEQYAIPYSGGETIIQANDVRVLTFDDGQLIVEEGEKVKVPIKDRWPIPSNYISEKERKVYSYIQNKENFENQFTIFLVFDAMKNLYEDYLNREPSEGLEKRKENLYMICYDYIAGDEDYTMGGYKFSDLDPMVQKDILKIGEEIIYMVEKGIPMERSIVGKFLRQQQIVLNYEVKKKGV